jgi:hypothetical protein
MTSAVEEHPPTAFQRADSWRSIRKSLQKFLAIVHSVDEALDAASRLEMSSSPKPDREESRPDIAVSLYHLRH